MNIERTIFRKYDIRGKYPSELDERAAYNIALSFAGLFPNVRTVAVGGDIRKSTPAVKGAVIRGLVDGGKEVIDAGIVITPVVYFGVCHFGYDAGIAVTASHLEGIYNGIKIVLKDAAPTTPEDYDRILDRIVNDEIQKAEQPGSVRAEDMESAYLDHITKKVKLARPLTIVIDTGNGTGRLLPERIFRHLGCEVHTIFAEPDDSSPNHIADPYKKENMQDLRKEVVKSGADLGIAFDGDGDRAGFVDASGYILSGDDLLLLFARDAQKIRKGPIVVDARASLALIEEMAKEGQETILTVGYHAAVLAKILEIQAVFGGETTSHFYFPLEFYPTDDAVFAALKLASIAAAEESFPKLVKSLPRYATSEEIFIEFPDTEKYQAVDAFTRMIKGKGLQVNDVDGSRVDLGNGWGIVRPSNTSAFIKAKFEGRTPEDLCEVAGKMVALMDEAGICMDAASRTKLGLAA